MKKKKEVVFWDWVVLGCDCISETFSAAKFQIQRHNARIHDVITEARVESTARKHRKRLVKSPDLHGDRNNSVRRRQFKKQVNILVGSIKHGGDAQDYRSINESER